MGVIIYNGISSEELGIHVESPPDYEVPERDYEIIPVPGRNGDIIIDKGAYKNVEREYKISIGEVDGDFSVLASKISSWLTSGYGYLRLEDTYNPDIYMLAASTNVSVITNILQQAGRTVIKFNRKPERFLKTGEFPIEFTKDGLIINPTNNISKPIVTIYGNGAGTVNIEGHVIAVSDISGYVTVDSDIGNAYKDGANKNSTISLSDGYPTLKAGSSDISFSGGVTKVEIIPRWWLI